MIKRVLVRELMALGIPTIVWKDSGGPEEVTGRIESIIPPVNSIVNLDPLDILNGSFSVIVVATAFIVGFKLIFKYFQYNFFQADL